MATRLPFVLMDLLAQINKASPKKPRVEISLDSDSYDGVLRELVEHYNGDLPMIFDNATAEQLVYSTPSDCAVSLKGEVICNGVIIRRKS